MKIWNLPGNHLTMVQNVIELNKLLKALRLVESGAMAGQWVEDGVVKVNGMVETRKRAKLRTDDVVEIPGYQIKIN
jgi:ribosome-associated protein